MFNKLKKLFKKETQKEEGFKPWFCIDSKGGIRKQGIGSKICFNEKSMWDKIKEDYPNYNDFRYWKYDINKDLVPCLLEEAQCINKGSLI